jgi:uracil-DNA glycosylase
MVSRNEDYALKTVNPLWPSRPTPSRKIAVIGEAPGVEEAHKGEPWVGASGKLIRRQLKLVGIDTDEIYMGNVFRTKPPENRVERFFTKTQEEADHNFVRHKEYGWPRKSRTGDIHKLYEDLAKFDPWVIIACGGTAMWALTGASQITKYRGSVIETNYLGSTTKVVPTFHPSFIMRGNWDKLSVMGFDVMRAFNESSTRELERPLREVWINPDLDDLHKFRNKFLSGAEIIGYDIETSMPGDAHYVPLRQIKSISFCADNKYALVVPIVDQFSPPTYRYWSADQEMKVWHFIKSILEDPHTRKLTHNGLFDVQYLYTYGIKVRGIPEDTIWLHHAYQPEMKKDLGTLGATYTDEKVAWKNMVSFKAGKKDG